VRVQYFCNPSNLDGCVYVRVRVRVNIRVSIMVTVSVTVSVRVTVMDRVCHDMFRTRSPMFDRLQK